MKYDLKLTDVRKSFLAKTAASAGLYGIFRILVSYIGYQNPYVCVIKTIGICNLKCRHCAWLEKTQPELETEILKQKIDEAYLLGCESVIFEGGEPTLRKDLGDLIKYAKNKKMNTIVITNGLNDFSQYSPDAFWVSIEGDRENNDKIRGAGVFERAKENIEKCKNKRIIILMTISKENFQDVKKMPELFSNNLIWYNFLYPYQNTRTSALDNIEIMKTAEEIKKMKKIFFNIINTDLYLSNAGKKVNCNRWWTYTVDFNGTSNIGCTAEQLEKCDCGKCFLACYAEPYYLLRCNPESFVFLKKISGRKKIL